MGIAEPFQSTRVYLTGIKLFGYGTSSLSMIVLQIDPPMFHHRKSKKDAANISGLQSLKVQMEWLTNRADL